MNIKEAKLQIKNAMTAYFSKDESGDYIVPIEKQRPVFLMGPPGIGKTAIMEQIASEMGVGLLSYSMTHHTRQSALGLPFIEHRKYKDLECNISEYTMSEIIASVYDMMEETGVEEGILFLDEINCVSETLAPVMLQFLQYKVFGKHRVPKGWIVVTAGNPPEYNNSVREFDIVTWDRLKRIDVEPELEVWKDYAYQKGVHPAVITYLEIKKTDFYKIESSVDGKRFVTARGWDDLSQMIQLYELNNIKVDQNLIGQYLQNPRIAKDFAIYYDLFLKYKSSYQVTDILAGKATEEIKNRARNAKFDERLALIGLLLDGVGDYVKQAMDSEHVIKDLMDVMIQTRDRMVSGTQSPCEVMEDQIRSVSGKLAAAMISSHLSYDDQRRLKKIIGILEEQSEIVVEEEDGKSAFLLIKKDFDERVKGLKGVNKTTGQVLSNMFQFAEAVFGEGHEMLIIVTELTRNPGAVEYISKYGCAEYFKYNKELLIYDRHQQILAEIENLNL